MFLGFCANAQNASKNIQQIDFNRFIELALTHNFDYLIEKFEVSKAEAAYKAAKVFQDPELEIILPRFIEDEFSGFPANIAFEMEIPIELFGKRRNRIRQARAEKFAAAANFEGYLYDLRTDIASVFISAITKQMVVERMKTTLEQLNQLQQINQTLFEAGERAEIEVLQTRIETRNYETELLDVQMDMADILSDFHFLIGGIPSDSIVFIGNLDLSYPLRSFTELKEHALNNSEHIIAATFDEEAAFYNKRLVQSERYPDISLIIGYHNDELLMPMAGLKYSYVGIRVPLRFSGFNKGAYRQGVYQYEQSVLARQLAVFQVEKSLNNAWEKHRILQQKRMLFSDEILKDSERVRDAILYSYQRGEASLLELIEAQRASNEAFMNYYSILAQYNLSLVELSRASYLWLLDL